MGAFCGNQWILRSGPFLIGGQTALYRIFFTYYSQIFSRKIALMKSPQTAILENDNAPIHHYLEFALANDANDEMLLGALKVIYKSTSDDNKAATVFGFSKKAWRMIRPDWIPAELQNFNSIEGKSYNAPSTQADLFFWISSHDKDAHGLVFDQARRALLALSGVADINLDQPAFMYHDSMDLMGFEDGSANPKEDERFQAALIPQGQIGEGGSYLLTQKWVHNLDSFLNLDVAEQEKIIGRTKLENIELTGGDMPTNSHVSRTDAELNGVALKVFRCSKPFGNTQEKGLYFVSFACELQRHQIQLERMYGVSDDGVTDRILEFSQAINSSYWFIPSESDLRDLF